MTGVQSMNWFSSLARWAVSAAAMPVSSPRYSIVHPACRGAAFTPDMLDYRIGR